MELVVQLKKTVAPNKIRECLLDNDYMSDVTFFFGNDEMQLKAHKMFLCTASPIFLQLFEGNFEENINVKMSSITKEIMLEVCRYAYTDSSNLTLANVHDILHAATKFEMKGLIEKCVDFIGKQLNDKNVFKFLIENQKHNNFRVNMKCFEYINKNHQKCFKNGDFLKISIGLLRMVFMTCKIPKDAAVNAITVWSRFNNNSDVDDLIAMLPVDEIPSTNEFNKTQQDQNSRRPRSRSKVNTNKQMSTLSQQLAIHDLTILGQTSHKNFKYANLDLLVIGRKVTIREIHFLYDLRQFDEKFEVALWKIEDKNRAKLYSDIVIINRPCLVYIFKKEIELPELSKIWLNIDFPDSKYRLSFNDFYMTQASDLVLRKDPANNSYAQIISKVIYTTKD
ncbi:hypothetical protein PVAND_009137 [Polypedilum vanderplanki]|uniref:BTB domain-containing protein n=1 Tax=Polypedilum vanderplanki TaxID=319348 RepID=A0A9J6CBQ0_POLVA|nr:hypothetical protein PVAND_009137 [Polypedilum vanderplanki]